MPSSTHKLPPVRISSQRRIRENKALEKYLQELQSKRLITLEEEVAYAQAVQLGALKEKEYKEQKKVVAAQIRRSKRSDDPQEIKKATQAKAKLAAQERKMLACKREANEAIKKLFEANLRFVISIAKMYLNRGVPLEDLVATGNIGLLRAILRFDPTRGFKLISYAVWWIIQAIETLIDTMGVTIRQPGSVRSQQQALYKISKRLTKQLGRPPSIIEIAEEADLPLEIVMHTLESNMKALSVDDPLKQGEDTTLRDVMSDTETGTPEDHLMDEAWHDVIMQAVNNLDERERKVIVDYYGLNQKDGYIKTLGDIGDDIGTTRERARQLREKATQSIRIYLTNKGYLDFRTESLRP